MVLVLTAEQLGAREQDDHRSSQAALRLPTRRSTRAHWLLAEQATGWRCNAS